MTARPDPGAAGGGAAPRPRTGGQVLVDQLRRHRVGTVFCVPGESYLAALDAMYDAGDAIRLYVGRQEGGTATMAAAYGRLTGEPGICFVTRGPGATNASIAVHTASQDSSPMILFVGQIDTGHSGREAFQELDYPRVFGGLAKWATQVDRAERLPEIVHRAFVTATSGRPGPVVVALPEDVLAATVRVADAEPYQRLRSYPSPAAMTDLAGLLAAAARPLLVVGGSDWDAAAARRVTRFAERWELPVVAAFRRQDLVDHRSGSYAGNLGAGAGEPQRRLVRDADLVLAVGTRLGDQTTGGYTLLEPPRPRQRLVHVYPAGEELGRVYQPDLALQCGPRELAELLDGLDPPEAVRWAGWRERARSAYLRWSTPPAATTGALDLARVVSHLNEVVPPDTVLTNGAGNYTVWAHRFYRFTEYPTQLGPVSGAMGYGLPAALAAQIAFPERLVIAFAGDGCLLMTGQELATAAQYQLPVIVLVVNNNQYGTIRLHQERRYPGRVIGTGLRNPDFVAFAESFGGYAERVHRTDEFPAAFARAVRAAGWPEREPPGDRRRPENCRPALLELVTDPDQSTPDTRLSAIRAAADSSTGDDLGGTS